MTEFFSNLVINTVDNTKPRMGVVPSTSTLTTLPFALCQRHEDMALTDSHCTILWCNIISKPDSLLLLPLILKLVNCRHLTSSGPVTGFVSVEDVSLLVDFVTPLTLFAVTLLPPCNSTPVLCTVWALHCLCSNFCWYC